MIFEFALEPQLVASWHNRSAYRFFDGKFGLGRRRIGCHYPKTKWKRLVMDAFHANYDGPQEKKASAKHRLDALVRHLEEGASYRQNSWKSAESWKKCISDEHGRRPFQGILVESSTDISCSAVLVADDVDESEGTDWNPETPVTPRTPSDFITALTPLLRCCREVKIIDPYLDLEKEKWSDTVCGFINELAQLRAADEIPKIEIHTSVDREFRGQNAPLQTEAEEKNKAEELIDSCRAKISASLTYPGNIRVFVWAQKSDSRQSGFDWLHNRYVLTNLGGVIFGHGIDAPGQGNDDLAVLPKATYLLRWSQYSKSSPAFKPVLDEEL